MKIGDHVKITGPTTILTHDYSTSVLNNIDKRIYGKQRKTIIGNNVFLGWGCTVLAGTTIGDNTIIGAGAVVSGHIDENSVYAGNPAKKICSIDDYKLKIINHHLIDAKRIYLVYKNKYNKIPPLEIFHEYFYVFTKSDINLNKRFKEKLKEENIIFNNLDCSFNNYEEFCDYCERSGEND